PHPRRWARRRRPGALERRGRLPLHARAGGGGVSATMSSAGTPGVRSRLGSVREHRTTVTVAALSTAFGVTLLLVTQGLGAALAADDFVQSAESGALLLGIVAVIFLTIAVYVSAIVT